jgi:hypothetical protein
MTIELQDFNNKVIEEYLNGNSVLSIANKYNTNTRKIQTILANNDISKISQMKRFNPLFIEDYFSIINSKEKAYWIGWLLTDGGVSNKNDIEIAIKNEDGYILHILENDLKISNKVKEYQNNYVRFSVSCKNMCEDLSQYGIIPNKTKTLKYPTNIPEEFDTHLLRGMFDGDGGFSIGTTNRFYKHRNKSYTKPYQELSFTGTLNMCENFQNTLLKYINMPKKNITKNHSIYRVRWNNKNEILSICNVLYKDCDNHYLKRKYDIYQTLQNGVVANELYTN